MWNLTVDALEIRDLKLQLIRSGKLNNWQLIELGYNTEDDEVWKTVAEYLDLSGMDEEELLAFGTKAGNFRVWGVIIKTGMVSNKKMFRIGNRNESWSIFRALAKPRELASRRMPADMYADKDNIVWVAIFKHLNHNDVTPKELFALGEKAKSRLVWLLIVATGILTAKQLIRVGKKYDDDDFWKAVIKQLDFSGMTTKEALPLIVQAKNWLVSLAFIAAHKLTNWHLIKVGLYNEKDDVWIAIAEQLDLSNMSTEELFELGSQAGNFRVWKVVNEARKLIEWKMSDGKSKDAWAATFAQIEKHCSRQPV